MQEGSQEGSPLWHHFLRTHGLEEPPAAPNPAFSKTPAGQVPWAFLRTPAWWGASASLLLAKLVAEATPLSVTVAGKGVAECGVSPDTPWSGLRVTRLQVPAWTALD